MPSGLNTRSPVDRRMLNSEKGRMSFRVRHDAEVLDVERSVVGTSLHTHWRWADGAWLQTETRFPPGTVLDEHAEGFDPDAEGEVVATQSNRTVSFDPQTGDIVLLDAPTPQRN